MGDCVSFPPQSKYPKGRERIHNPNNSLEENARTTCLVFWQVFKGRQISGCWGGHFESTDLRTTDCIVPEEVELQQSWTRQILQHYGSHCFSCKTDRTPLLTDCLDICFFWISSVNTPSSSTSFPVQPLSGSHTLQSVPELPLVCSAKLAS